MEKFLWSVFVLLILAMSIESALVVFFPPDLLYLIIFVLLFGFIANILFSLFLFFLKAKKIHLLELKRTYYRKCFKRGIPFGLFVVLLLMVQLAFGVV